jgi:hypothetical protein
MVKKRKVTQEPVVEATPETEPMVESAATEAPQAEVEVVPAETLMPEYQLAAESATPVQYVELLVKNLGPGTVFWLGGEEYRFVKTDLYPLGSATIISLVTGQENQISNYTTVLVKK